MSFHDQAPGSPQRELPRIIRPATRGLGSVCQVGEQSAGARLAGSLKDTPQVMGRWARSLLCAVLASTGAASSALAQDAPLGTTVQGLLAFARAQSPEISAMRQEADAAGKSVV